MKNAIELDWPTLGPEVNKKIVEHYEQFKHQGETLGAANSNKDVIKEKFIKQGPGFHQLQHWPERDDFLAEIFQGHNINTASLNHIGIQCSIDEIGAHTDTYRTMGVIYAVDGPADTVFYKQKNTDQKPGNAKAFKKEDIIETERYRFTIGKWYLINNSEIHGIDNYRGRRISLIFNLTDLGVFKNYEDAAANIKDSKILFL
jgi:hypothetical protein